MMRDLASRTLDQARKAEIQDRLIELAVLKDDASAAGNQTVCAALQAEIEVLSRHLGQIRSWMAEAAD